MSDDPQAMMNRAKKEVIMDTLAEHGGTCTFLELFQVADAKHCDVLTAALMSLQRKKVVAYEGAMLLNPADNNVKITLMKPEYDPFA